MFGCCSRAAASASARNRASSIGARELAAQDHLQATMRLRLTCRHLEDDAHAATAKLAKDFIARHRAPHGARRRNTAHPPGGRRVARQDCTGGDDGRGSVDRGGRVRGRTGAHIGQ